MAFDSGHALVIGIGEYPKAASLNTAKITALDAQVVAEVLKTPTLCGYPESQVCLLHNEQATRDNILAELERLAQVTKKGDTVFLFYSGHGKYGEDKHFYLTTYDTELNDDLEVRVDSGIREQQLLSKIKDITATRALLIFNACHSGEIKPMVLGGDEAETPATQSGQNVPEELTTALLSAGEGRVIITACRESQRSYFNRKDPATLFAKTLSDGLRGTGIMSRRNTISLFDLYEYVFTKVSEVAKQRWDVEQEPVLTISQGVGIMSVALYQGKQRPGVLGDDEDEESAPDSSRLRGRINRVAPEDSKKEFDRLMSGKINVNAQGDVKNNTIIGEGQTNIARDQIDLRYAQGPVLNPTGTTHQVFGTQRNVNTGGGDYAEGNIDKRRGIFGGRFSGPAIGSMEGGTATFNPSPASPSSAGSGVTIQFLYDQIQQIAAQARTRGNDDLGDDLGAVATNLDQAIKAQQANKTERYLSKLAAAREDLAEIAKQEPLLSTLSMLLQQIK